jgi:death-on-curing protein
VARKRGAKRRSSKRALKRQEPLWIETRDVLAIHDRLLALHGGAPGLRDLNLLESALARPRQHFFYADSPDIIKLAAIQTAGIVRNHPFVDGNKRTGFVTGILFLELNGFDFTASEEEATRAVLDLAAGALDEDEYGAWLLENVRVRK